MPLVTADLSVLASAATGLLIGLGTITFGYLSRKTDLRSRQSELLIAKAIELRNCSDEELLSVEQAFQDLQSIQATGLLSKGTRRRIEQAPARCCQAFAQETPVPDILLG